MMFIRRHLRTMNAASIRSLPSSSALNILCTIEIVALVFEYKQNLHDISQSGNRINSILSSRNIVQCMEAIPAWPLWEEEVNSFRAVLV